MRIYKNLYKVDLLAYAVVVIATQTEHVCALPPLGKDEGSTIED
jgi:hypothetical protein